MPAMDGCVKSLTRVNDFVVKFANVNGSGSASANGLFARAILRMGVPVAARNIFPSNIQGLPTWYAGRVVGDGWGRRAGGRVARAAWRRRPHGRHESAGVGKGRRRGRSGRLPLLRLDPSHAAVAL